MGKIQAAKLGILTKVQRLLCGFLLLLVLHSVGIATTSSTDGWTPANLTAGAPAGSYPLSGFDQINLFNGNLNFRLPLVQVGGRGDAQYTIMLAIETHWRVLDRSNDFQEIWLPTSSPWYDTTPGYGPGLLLGRSVGLSPSGGAPCLPYPAYSYLSLTRLTFILPDGTEVELRDRDTGGQTKISTCSTNGYNRGTVFVTADGTAATFVSDVPIYDQQGVRIYPSGYMMLRNGLRYRIDSGHVSWMRDRNGNKLTFTYGDYARVTSITDSLNRITTISYANFSTVFYDEIGFKGFDGAQRTIQINYDDLHDRLRTDRAGDKQSVQTLLALFPELTGSSTTDYDPNNKVSSVTLPDTVQQFQFRYNAWGELARVVLPTGGIFEYDFVGASPDGNADGVYGIPEPEIYRRVSEKRIYSDENIQETKIVFNGGNVDQFDASGTILLSREKHYFYGNPTIPSSVGPQPFDYPAWDQGKEYQTEVIDTTNCTPSTCATVLRRMTNLWQQGCTVSAWSSAIANNPRVVEVDTTLSDTNQVTAHTFAYDCHNNKTDSYEYDFGSSAPGALLRRSHTDYVTATNYTDAVAGVHLRSLPTLQSVSDAGGIELARTTYEYDNYAPVTNHATLQTYPRSGVNELSISGLDAAFNSNSNSLTRGNVTATTSYLITNGSAPNCETSPLQCVSTYAQYDIAGNLVKGIDARGFATTVDFGDRFGAPNGDARANSGSQELSSAAQHSYAFPTLITNPLGHQAYTQFDYYTGRPVDAEDANGVVSSVYYNDPLDRPKKIVRAANQPASLQSQTTFGYDETLRVVTSTSDQVNYNDNLLKSQTLYDRLGRVTEKRTYEGATNYIAVQQQYDALGRAYKTSNPFRPWQSETPIWTITAFDALGRIYSVTSPDSAVVQSRYSGNLVLVTDQDQIGKQRLSRTNALGQLSDVWEITAADTATESISFPNHPEVAAGYRTKYLYDVLDDLTSVTQRIGTNGALQTRTFVYDSLKRLKTATNPESGTISYQYDKAGNLLVKTDARGVSPHGVSTHFEYDGLNRVKRRWYNGSDLPAALLNNDPTLAAGVAPGIEVKYTYDSEALPDVTVVPTFTRGASIGKLVAVTYGGGSEGDYHGYDALGRQALKIQRTGSVNYRTSVGSYNRADAIMSQTYPSDHMVSYNYDQAGRLANDGQNPAFSGNLGGVTRTYSSGILYSPFGGISKEQFGTDTAIFNKLFYNVRGQLAEIRASTSYSGPTDTTWNRGAIINHYSEQCWGMCTGLAMPDNNGNLKKQDNYIPEQGSSFQTFTQGYNYDALNRLQSVTESKSTNGGTLTQSWAQAYTYDRFGNRSINQAGTTQDVGLNSMQAAVETNTATNRMYAPGETGQTQNPLIKYDDAGNQTKDYYTGVPSDRIYDAENRMVSATATDSLGSQTSTYTYDGNGARVKRDAAGTKTWQVYGLGGELLAEYAENGAAASPQKEYGYRNGQLLVTATPGTRTNVALAANGAVATASSQQDAGRGPAAAINGDRKGIHWGTDAATGSGWNNGTTGLPAWLQVDFNGSKTIDEIDLFAPQDDYTNPIEPTQTMTFSLYGLSGFDIQYWNGTAWATITGCSVTSNNKVWRQFNFSAITTTKIRVLTNASPDSYSRMTELEAWTPATTPTRSNYALAANGAVATATSQQDAGRGPAAAINGDRKGIHWGTDAATGSGWNNGTTALPAWLQVDFNGSKTIDEIDVFGPQDDYTNPIEPTASLTFSLYSLSGFDVQYWTGSAWATVPGCSVSGNDKVWRQFTFTAITTTKIRVLTNASPDSYSRLTELEAWGTSDGGGSTSAEINWLVTDQLGTPRMVFDKSGSLANMKRHDYLPFGEELLANQGGRTTTQGYSVADNIRQKFTSKERDIETGLDYFGYRYYGSTQGRFTSVDPENYQAMGDLSDPQSWNAYSYVNNNPLRRVDPDGRGFFWEKLKNALNGYGWKTDVQVEEIRKADEQQRRQELQRYSQSQGLNGYVIVSGNNGQPQAVSVDSLSRSQVVQISQTVRYLQAGIDVEGVGTINHNDALSLISGALGNLPGPNGGRIADGHAWDKHQSEFPGWDKGKFAQKINETIQSARGSNMKSLSNGRTAYWNEQEKMVVIRDPKTPDGGTAFRPTNGKAYFNNLK